MLTTSSKTNKSAYISLSVFVLISTIGLTLKTPIRAAQNNCSGKTLSISIEDYQIGESDRFEFSLDVETSAENPVTALDKLNKKIEKIKNSLGLISLKKIKISSQRIYFIEQLPKKEIGTAILVGEAKNYNYKNFINAIKSFRGVRVHNITSLISNESKIDTNQKLISNIMKKGRNKAKQYASILKKNEINLMAITELKDNRSNYFLTENNKKSINQYQPPSPEKHLNLNLLYCIY